MHNRWFYIQAEFKLGFIAQSCLAPGFSSMMSNLFAMRAGNSHPDMKQWQRDYLEGTGCEMYTETLSVSFIGMTFSQAAETCFVKVKLKGHYKFSSLKNIVETPDDGN